MAIFDPVKLSPVFKDYLWGGEKLKTHLNKKCSFDRVAESWELSAHKDGQSVVQDGEFDGMVFSDYLAQVGSSVLGEKSKKYDYFPLLIKFIDAKKDLSVQVHPSDEYALANEGEYGKTEMWYVLDCDEDACLYYGFSRDVTLEEYENAIKEMRLTEILNRVKVKKGDVYFIPAGTVHAIGAGNLICEIQQNSNTTYRVYDYGRRDAEGNLRPLHVEKALKVSSLKKSPELTRVDDVDGAVLSECEYFTVKKRIINGRGSIEAKNDSFISLIVTDGCGSLEYGESFIELAKGDSVFIPAQNRNFEITGSCQLVVSYLT